LRKAEKAVFDALQQKVKILTELMWDNSIDWNDVERWLENYPVATSADADQRLHALHLLSHFSYFNTHVTRVLLRSLYRDLVQYPLITEIRRAQGGSLDLGAIGRTYRDERKRIRFIAMGNPSESGAHLLYYFRQENALPKTLFVQTHELFDSSDPVKLSANIKKVVFVDDLCGSGTQAYLYSKKLLSRLLAADSTIELCYFPLFATTQALAYVKANTQFTRVEALYELDHSFRSLEPESRYFQEAAPLIFRDFARQMCIEHGRRIEPGMPLGYRDGQLLLGFAHNVPDNSLPIFWSEGRGTQRWTPIFRRYPKIYS